jgi:hypothetical protein
VQLAICRCFEAVNQCDLRALLHMRQLCQYTASSGGQPSAHCYCCCVLHTARDAPSKWLTTPSNSSITRRRWSAVQQQHKKHKHSPPTRVDNGRFWQVMELRSGCHSEIYQGPPQLISCMHARNESPGRLQSRTQPAAVKQPDIPGCLGSESDCARMMCSLQKKTARSALNCLQDMC